MLSWLLAVAATVLVPIAMSVRGMDPFRLPKDLLFIAFAIAIAVAGITAWLRRRPDGTVTTLRTVPLLAITAVAWTALATLFSTNRALSRDALLWVSAIAIFAIAVDLGGRTRGVRSIAWPLIPAAINAVIFLLQRFHIWNPMTFTDDIPEHFRHTALLGNPDDVGSLLVAPAIVAVALAVSDRARRLVWGPVAALLLLALVTGRLTSLIACGAALLAMGFLRSRRAGVIATALLLAGGIALVTGYRPMRERTAAIVAAVRARDFAEATSGRVTPFLAAALMAKDHPIFGVGPGCFRWRYFDYKLAAESAHPVLARTWGADFNFGETHNDHLQTLAETGILGYAIFVAALVVLAASSRRPQEAEAGQDVPVRLLALPLALGIGILCLGHFPLHLAASTVVIVYVAAFCVSRGQHAEITARPAIRARIDTLLRPRFIPASLAAAILIVTIIGGALITWRVAWQPWQCNVMKKAIDARTSLVYEIADNRFRTSATAHENLAALEPCLAATPADVGTYMLVAANDRLLGRFDEAAAMYRRALQYDRRPELYYNLGLTELELRQRGPAVADLIIAVRFSRQYMADLPPDVQSEITDALRRQYPYLVGT